MQIHLDSNGLSLLRKGKQGFFRIVFSRLGLIVLLLALQVMVLFSIFQWFEAFLRSEEHTSELQSLSC